MRRNLTVIVGLAFFGLAVVLVWKVLPAAAGRRGIKPSTPSGARPDPADISASLDAIRSAGALLAPSIYRRERSKHDDRRNDKDSVLSDLRGAVEQRGGRVCHSVAAQVEDHLGAGRYADAAVLIERHRVAWKALPAATALAAMLDELRTEQDRLLAGHKEDVERLIADARLDAAEDALGLSAQLEDAFVLKLRDTELALRRQLRVAQHRATASGRPVGPTQRPGVKPTIRALPPPPPPLPSVPHPDVKRLAEARALLKKAKRLFQTGRHGPASNALDDFTGFFGDLAFVKREAETVAAMRAVSLYRVQGVKGLFHAADSSIRGQRIRLVYRFETDAEWSDWEELATLPHRSKGEFRPTRSGVRGTGVMSLLHRGVFASDVAIRCVSVPNAKKSHGLLFAQDGLETRQLMWLVTNHWLVEGENYRKERPGHSILMFGKGVNADVPVDSPETGFIFRGATIRRPQPAPGGDITLSFTYKNTTMTGAITYRGATGERGGSTLGDDGRGIDRVRPGMFVLENTVVFKKIVIEGKLHASFEKRRVRELLDRIR